MNQTTNTGIIGGNPLPCSSCEHMLICKFSDEMAKAQEIVSRLCKENTVFAGNFIKPIKVECYHYKTQYQTTLTRDWVNPCEYGPTATSTNAKPLNIKYSDAVNRNTSKINYVRVPKNHILIDFDIPDEDDGQKLRRLMEVLK